MKIHELVESGSVGYPDGQQHTVESIQNLNIDDEAEFEGSVTLDRRADILGAQIGAKCVIHLGAFILRGAYLDRSVHVGPDAEIGHRDRIFEGAKIGAYAVLQPDVIVGPDVTVPAGSQIGAGMIIPSPKTIMVLGPVGSSHRTMTIHGSDDGPRYSAGCQYSDDEATITYRIVNGVETSPESAEHYGELLDAGVIQTIGRIVQAHYDEDVASGLVTKLREQSAAITVGPSQESEEE